MSERKQAYKLNSGVSLSKSDEAKFQRWVRLMPWYREFVDTHGERPDLDTYQYDYRAAYKAGAVPTYSVFDGKYHWPSEFKTPAHPTYWKKLYIERTGQNPDEIKWLQRVLQGKK